MATAREPAWTRDGVYIFGVGEGFSSQKSPKICSVNGHFICFSNKNFPNRVSDFRLPRGKGVAPLKAYSPTPMILLNMLVAVA